MRILLISISMLISISSVFGQKVKKVIIENQSPPFRETFYVLKSNKKIKHGIYKKEIRGRLGEKGEFQNGVKTGIWEYYDMHEVLAQKIDIQTGELLYHSPGNGSSQFDLSKLPRRAIILGGMSVLYRHVMFSLRYPKNARKMVTEGKVLVMFTVDKFGEMGKAVIVKGIGNGCDEEAARVINSLDQKWLPALDAEGKAVKSKITLPITFRLG